MHVLLQMNVLARSCDQPILRRLVRLVGLTVLAGAGPARSQAPAPHAGSPSGRPPTAEAPRAVLRADSTFIDTTIQPGRLALTAYPTPGRCLAAARAVEALAHLAATDSTGDHYNPMDTLTTAAVTTARRCGAHFAVATVTPADLLDLAQLALVAGDDATARAATDRYAATVTEPAAHRWAVYAAETLAFHAKPRRWALVDTVTAQLDALGAAAALQRKLVHDELYLDARERYDVARLRREVLALLAVCPQLGGVDPQESGSCNERELGLTLFVAALYQTPGNVPAALEQTRQQLQGTGFKDWAGFRQAILTTPFLHAEQLGKPVPPLVVQQWLGPAGRPPGWPVRGKVSLYLHGNVAEDDPKKMALWKRLGEKYRDVLDIVVLLPTQGYFRNGAPLTVAEEGARLRTYYREQLGLPVTVAVVETPVTQLPLPDGRILRGAPPLATDPYYSEPFLLVDRAGKLVLRSPFGAANEAMLDAWVAHLAGR